MVVAELPNPTAGHDAPALIQVKNIFLNPPKSGMIIPQPLFFEIKQQAALVGENLSIDVYIWEGHG